MAGASELVDVVERRLDFLERLLEDPLRKHELVDELGHSRSTVNRAIDELEAAGLVAAATDGYRTTLTGRLLARGYRRFLTVANDVDAASEALAPLGSDASIEPVALRDADVFRAAAPDPYRPLERLDEVLAGADAVAAALPALPYPRLLDRCRRAAADGRVDLALSDSTYRHARDRYADTLAGLARRGGAAVSVVDAVDVGVLVADDAALLLVFDEDGRVHGAIESTDPEAVAWARDRVDRLAAAGRDAGEELAAMEAVHADPADGASGFDGRLGSADDGGEALAEQGFATFDDDLLGRDPDPTAPLRATPSFAEVDAGYALDRTAARDGGRRSVADELIEGLAAGDDRVLVGPRGSGKSTVCRLAAVRWYRSGRGPVLYRAGDGGGAFTATERLRERATAADGHALVVVEDAVDPDAAEAVSVARTLADRDDVSFLFDARAAAYDDPDSLPLSPADLGYRRRIEAVRMPRLDEREAERFAEHVADLVGGPPVADPAALLDGIRGSGPNAPVVDGSGDAESGAAAAEADRPGELLCLLHHLVRAGGRATGDAPVRSPERGDGAGSEVDSGDGPPTGPETGFEASVEAAVRDVVDRPPPTADVAVLVNLLNVAGAREVRELAYALVGDGERGRDASPEAVRRALGRLEGSVLVPAPGDPDRTVHEEWSVLFLERLLDREPEPVVARRVGRVATRLLSLADDPARRSRVRRAVGGDAPATDRIERDPEEWASEMTRRLYGVGRRYPRLAGLYGRVRYSWIDLPDACPPELRDRAPEWVARMYVDAGDLDGAVEALDAWRPTDEAGEAERQRGLGDVARRRGEHDAARERYERSAELFESAGDRRGLAAAIRGCAQAAHFAGDYEAAYEDASQAYAVAAAIDDPIATAKALMDAGNALDALDATDAVVDHYRVAGDLFRAYDDLHGEANVRANLAVARRRRGELAAAERAAERALDGYRTVGDEHREAVVLLTLGAIAEQRGAADEAAARAREARDAAERVGADLYRALAVSNLGSAAQLAGDLDRAERLLRDALGSFEALDADDRCAMAAATLADVAVDRGDLEGADRWIDRADAALGDRANPRRRAILDRLRGAVALRRGEPDDAERAVADAISRAREGGFTDVEARALADFGAIAAEHGDAAAAADRLTEAIDLAREVEYARALVEAADGMTDLLSDRDASALDPTAPDPIPEESAAAPAAYRELADRWRADGVGVAFGAGSAGGS